MDEPLSEYADYVENPRYGREPRITGFDPPEQPDMGILHWIFPPESRIPNTGILADPNRQKVTSFPMFYYFDQKKICNDCQRPFLFFAEEQKFWYEELRFDLNSTCIHCFPCLSLIHI